MCVEFMSQKPQMILDFEQKQSPAACSTSIRYVIKKYYNFKA